MAAAGGAAGAYGAQPPYPGGPAGGQPPYPGGQAGGQPPYPGGPPGGQQPPYVRHLLCSNCLYFMR